METPEKSPFQTPQNPQGDRSAFAPVGSPASHEWPYTQATARRSRTSERLRAAQTLARSWPAAISGQHGHDTTFALACTLARRGLETEAILQILLNDYNRRCNPEWTEAELRHKAEDACARIITENEAEPECAQRSKTCNSGGL
jgi:hypothetical protein